MIRLSWLRSVEFEDRHWATGARDAFHPTLLPDDPLAQTYAQELAAAGFNPRLRVADAGGPGRLFSSEGGRHLLEQQFLLAGLKIRVCSIIGDRRQQILNSILANTRFPTGNFCQNRQAQECR